VRFRLCPFPREAWERAPLLVPHHLRIADADHAAADSIAGVAGRLLRFEVVRLGVDNERAPDDRVGAVELDHRVGPIVTSVTLAIGLKIAQVADMTLGIVRSGMRHSFRVEVTAGAFAVGH